MNPVLEHAARVLDHQPTRSMEAGTLHLRTVRETGLVVTFPAFLKAVGERPDQFAVIPPDPVVRAAAAWDSRQRSLYEASLEAAGLTQPLIVLAEGRPRAHEPGTDTASAAVTPADVFGDVHDALTHLLHAADPDDALYTAVADALEELHAARRLLQKPE